MADSRNRFRNEPDDRNRDVQALTAIGTCFLMLQDNGGVHYFKQGTVVVMHVRLDPDYFLINSLEHNYLNITLGNSKYREIPPIEFAAALTIAEEKIKNFS